MYIIKQKHTHRHRQQTIVYQCGEESGERQNMGMGLRDTSYYV